MFINLVYIGELQQNCCYLVQINPYSNKNECITSIIKPSEKAGNWGTNRSHSNYGLQANDRHYFTQNCFY